MPQYSEKEASNNLRKLSSAYPIASDTGPNITWFGNNQNYALYAGAMPGTPSYNWGNTNFSIANGGALADKDTAWRFERTQQDCYNGGSHVNFYDACNTFIATDTGTYTIRSYHSGNTVYKNGTAVASSVNAFLDPRTFSVSAGDRIQSDYPITLRSPQGDLGGVYMGWVGYTFGHRRDRNSGATLHMVFPESGTNYKVLYTLTSGYQTSLSQQTSGTYTGGPYGRRTVTLSSTRNYYIISDRPMACYVELTSGGGTNDTLPLYPMDMDDKYGQFSGAGHILSVPSAYTNRLGNATTQAVYNWRTNGNMLTEFSQASAASNSVYTDDAATGSGGTFFSGEGSRIIGSNNIFTAESQADGNGSEMTTFVSKAAFGVMGMVSSTTDWVYFISDNPVTIEYYDESHNLQTQFNLSGNSTTGVYDYKWTAGAIPEGSHFLCTTRGGTFQMYHDSSTSNDDEQTVIMANNWSVPN